MELSEPAYDFFGQPQQADSSRDVRRVLEGKSKRAKRREIEEVLDKTKKVTELKSGFDEIKYAGNLEGRNVAKTSGRYRTRLTLDNTFYGFPEALQMMVLAHENVHALERQNLLHSQLDKAYNSPEIAEKLEKYMKGTWSEREAATHLLATKTLGNNFFRDFRSGVDVKGFEKKIRREELKPEKVMEKGKGLSTSIYSSGAKMVAISDEYEPDKPWEGLPSDEQVDRSEDWFRISGRGEPMNDRVHLAYKIIEGSTTSIEHLE